MTAPARTAAHTPAPTPDIADLSGYRAVHAALRTAAHRLADAATAVDPGDHHRTAAFARYWSGYAGEILAHHTIEDEVFFPALVARVPEAAGLIERTDVEHAELDELMASCTDSIGHLAAGGSGRVAALDLRALAAHIDDHLAFEDAEILPLFEQRFTAEEYRLLDEQAIKHLGIGRQAAFTVPFIVASVGPDEGAHLLAEAPLAFRVLHRLTRRRHARLATAALGTDHVHRSTLDEEAPR